MPEANGRSSAAERQDGVPAADGAAAAPARDSRTEGGTAMGVSVVEAQSGRTEPSRGSSVVDAALRLVQEGNARRVTVRRNGEAVATFPLMVGLVGAVLAPALAAVGVATAMLADCTIAVERRPGQTAATVLRPARDGD
jgi:hypothetical protein